MDIENLILEFDAQKKEDFDFDSAEKRLSRVLEASRDQVYPCPPFCSPIHGPMPVFRHGPPPELNFSQRWNILKFDSANKNNLNLNIPMPKYDTLTLNSHKNLPPSA